MGFSFNIDLDSNDLRALGVGGQAPPLGGRPPSRGDILGPQRFRLSFAYLLGLAPAAIIYLAFAHASYGGWIDKSLQLWYSVDTYRIIAPWGPFSLHYLPINLWTALFAGWGISRDFPWIYPTTTGQSLLLTSPALLLALRAPWRDNWVWWMAIGMVMTPCLLVYANGFEQFGARYWTLVLPFFLLLMRNGWRSDRLAKALIVVSIALVSWGWFTLWWMG